MKNIIFRKTTLLLAISLLSLVSHSQTGPRLFGKPVRPENINPENGLIRCGTMEYEQYLQEKYPERQTRAQFEEWLAPKIEAARLKRMASPQETNAIVTIPVVVHVIHNGDAIGVNENIATAQVVSQITVLNQDFRRMSGTPGYNNVAVGADMEIQFAFAVIDPDGNTTDGIDRVNLGVATWNNEDNIDNSLKPATTWDPTKYFNIWVCNFGPNSDLLGYAQFPSGSQLPGLSNNGGSGNTDGVVIGYQYFGSVLLYPQGNYQSPYNRGRTATHEIGHCFGLRHINGDNDNSCTVNSNDSTKDFCPDTPATLDYNYGCPNGIDSCPSAPNIDMIRNYMEYTDDYCMNIFTQDQKGRMQAVLQNSPRRASLTSSTVWLSTDKFALTGFSVYPNPAKDILTITAENGDLPDSYTVINSLGQTIAQSQVSSAANLTVNTSYYSNGIYFIKVNKGNRSSSLKFIKN